MNFTKSKHRPNSSRIIAVKRQISLALAVLLFSVFSLSAQTPPPEAPKPPQKSKATSYSISIDDDDDVTHNSSISISVSDDSYKFRGSYHKSKNDGVKAMLIKSLGKNTLKVSGDTYLWSENQGGDEVFECKLTKGHLRMHADLDFASEAFVEKINKLGNDLKYFISGTDPKKEEAKNAEKAKRDIERAQRDLERAKRDLERAERNAKKAKGN